MQSVNMFYKAVICSKKYCYCCLEGIFCQAPFCMCLVVWMIPKTTGNMRGLVLLNEEAV